MKASWRMRGIAVALLVSATLGAGIFSLPYVFFHAGWAVSAVFLVILGAFTIFTHVLYWRVLEKTEEKNRLLGLVRSFLGRDWYYFGILVIGIGLSLTLLAYLSVSSQFLTLIFPGVSRNVLGILFWLLASLPLLGGLSKFVELQTASALAKVGIVLFVIIWVPFHFAVHVAAITIPEAALPFGALFFALSGWTAIEPIFDWRRRHKLDVADGASGKPAEKFHPVPIFTLASLISACLYIFFAIAIIHSSGTLTTDTLSGLTNWPIWKRLGLEAFAVFSIWASYMLISREVRKILQTDLRWPKPISILAVALFPITLFGLGIRDFLILIELVGGVFLGCQYLLILAVARAVLPLSRKQKFFLYLARAVFFLAIVYEFWYVLLK